MTEIISDKLWLGDYDDANDLNFLNKNGITLIICCARELLYKLDNESIEIYYYLIDDDEKSNIAEYFDIIANVIHSNKRCLVHCLAGVNRSPTIVAAYLIKYLYMTTDNALQYIKELRDEIDPLDEFIDKLRVYENNK